MQKLFTMTRNILRPPRNYCRDISGRDSSVIGDPGSCRRWTTIIHRVARSARNEGMAEPRCVRGEGSNERAAFSWRPFSTSITSPPSPGPSRLREPTFKQVENLIKLPRENFRYFSPRVAEPHGAIFLLSRLLPEQPFFPATTPSYLSTP